jgi:hypothetical protein
MDLIQFEYTLHIYDYSQYILILWVICIKVVEGNYSTIGVDLDAYNHVMCIIANVAITN